MSMNTLNSRRFASQVLPVPDGTISKVDRWHVSDYYPGILPITGLSFDYRSASHRHHWVAEREVRGHWREDRPRLHWRPRSTVDAD